MKTIPVVQLRGWHVISRMIWGATRHRLVSYTFPTMLVIAAAMIAGCGADTISSTVGQNGNVSTPASNGQTSNTGTPGNPSTPASNGQTSTTGTPANPRTPPSNPPTTTTGTPP